MFPRGASPRTAWMVPYDVNREYESRVFIGEVSAVGGVLLPLDLTAARDVKILQSISQA